MIYSPPQGFYQIDDKIYFNKDLALCSNKNISEIKWNFHDDIFSAEDWTKKPRGTLKDLYKERAQQLRDQYDYLVVHFSGGADSWNILNSFFSNGIKIDEVFTRWGLAERKFKAASSLDLGEKNLGSEFEYAVIPVLEYIKKNYPKTKIFIDDISFCFQQEMTEKHLLDSYQYKMMQSPFRFSRKSEYQLAAEKQNKRVAVVCGYDKIKCEVKDGNFYAFFQDGIGGGETEQNNNMEFFYWSKNFTKLPIMQAHYIKDYFLENGVDKTIKYRSLYTKICYPEYNNKTLQVNKLLGTYISASDNWIMLYNPRYYDSWRWHINQFYKSIDNKFISFHKGVKVGLEPSKGKKYLIEQNCKLPDICWNYENSYGQ
jgi:hypothetical protein